MKHIWPLEAKKVLTQNLDHKEGSYGHQTKTARSYLCVDHESIARSGWEGVVWALARIKGKKIAKVQFGP